MYVIIIYRFHLPFNILVRFALHQDYFTHFELSQLLGVAKQEIPEKQST